LWLGAARRPVTVAVEFAEPRLPPPLLTRDEELVRLWMACFVFLLPYLNFASLGR
jgi:hypothetical protein